MSLINTVQPVFNSYVTELHQRRDSDGSMLVDFPDHFDEIVNQMEADRREDPVC